jgi:hypothetical protein
MINQPALKTVCRYFLLLLLIIAVAAAAAWSEDLPPGWTASPLDDFDALPLTVTPPPSPLLRDQFSEFKLSPAKDVKVSGSGLKWQFTSTRADSAATVVVEDTELQGQPGFDGFALFVKNPGQHPLELSLRLNDANGATFVTKPQFLGDQKGWFQYVFRLDARDAGQSWPAAPYQTLELVLSGAEPAKAYTLYFDDLSGLSAPPPEVRLSALVAPKDATAGKALPLQVKAQLVGAAGRPVSIYARLSRGTTPVSHCAAVIPANGGQPQTLNLALPVPAHLASGAYRLSFDRLDKEIAEAPEQEIQIAAPPPFSRVAVNSPANGGGIVVDGAALPIIGGWSGAGNAPQKAPWIMFPCTSDYDPTSRSGPVWVAPDRFSYAELDRRLAGLVAANPDAYLIPVVTISSPPWWDQQHPKELMVFGDGKTVLPPSVGLVKRTAASWSSPVWRKDASAALTRLIQHLEDGPFGPAIIGYQLASGEDGRWVYPGASNGVFADYSHAQQEAFRGWLKNKYGDVRTLRIAWSQPGLPVNTAEALKETRPIMGWSQARIPDQTQRLRGPSGVLHDPNAAQEVVDYQIFSSDQVADTIRFFAAAAGEAVGERKLIGAAYGHIFDLAATRYGVQNGGHLALAPVCEAPELDFLVSGGSFGETGGPPLMTTAGSSVLAHGKAWITVAESRFAQAGLVNGLIGGGLIAQEGYQQDKLPPALRALPAQLDRSSTSEIAVIVDDISAAYTSCGPELVKPLLSDQRVSLSLMGAPVDVWTLDDLMQGTVSGYKLYIFLDCFYLDSQWRKQLVSLLAQQSCTALWVYAPGAIDQNIGGRTMKDLTGLTLVPWAERRQGDAELPTRVDKGLLQVKVGEGYTYGAPVPLSPRFICVDDKADVRGTLAGTSFGGLAVKDLGTLKSVWSAAPHLPATLLRDIAADADVHLYSDNADGVYANRSLIMVRAAADGERVIKLPKLAQVYDLADGNPVGKKSSEFRVRLKAGQIGLYYYGEGPLVDR